MTVFASDPRWLIGLAVGPAIFLYGLIALKRKMLIDNVPTSKIRALAMGLVEISGTVVPAKGKILRSPVSGKECVYYKYSVKEERLDGITMRRVTVSSGEEKAPFFLKDDTGAVLVDLTSAEISVPEGNSSGSGLGRDPPPHLVAFLKARGINPEGLFGIDNTMRYTEEFIAPADKLYVLGTAGENPSAKASAKGDHLQGIMMQRGRNDKTYFVSGDSEMNVVSELADVAWYAAIGGAALTAVSLVVVLQGFGIL